MMMSNRTSTTAVEAAVERANHVSIQPEATCEKAPHGAGSENSDHADAEHQQQKLATTAMAAAAEDNSSDDVA